MPVGAVFDKTDRVVGDHPKEYVKSLQMFGRRRKKGVAVEPNVEDREKARERTMNRAVKLLAAKPRSIGELRERLLEKPWTDREIVDGVIQKLRGYGYLDDQQFALNTALSKIRTRPQGRRKLEQSMSRKNLDRETLKTAIDAAFEKLPESELIDAAIEKRIRLKGRPKDRDELKKFYDHLLRQGFGYGLIRDKMNAVGMDVTEDKD